MLKHGIKSGIWNGRDGKRKNRMQKTESTTGKWNVEMRIICSVKKPISRNSSVSCRHQRAKIYSKFNSSQYKHVSNSSLNAAFCCQVRSKFEKKF